jgi:uncharacterized membrane protein YgcG
MEGFMNGVHTVAQISVLIIRKIDVGYMQGSPSSSVSERFAKAVRHKWGVGEKGKENGILVFLSIDDRTAYISTGKDISGKLPQDRISKIIERMKPDLRALKYDDALEKCVLEICSIVIPPTPKSSSLSSTTAKDDGAEDSSDFVGPAVFASICLAGLYLFTARQARVRKGCAALANIATEVTESAASNRYRATSCPICLDPFPAPSPPEPDAAPTAPPARRPMALHCGHVFCWECLEHHLRSSPSKCCPICRDPVDPAEPRPDPARPRPAAPHAADTGTDVMAFTADRFADHAEWLQWRAVEAEFRLGRVQALYPGAVAPSAHTRLVAALNAGDAEAFRSAMAGPAAGEWQCDEGLRAAAEEIGRGGASYIFGGGDNGGGWDGGGGGGGDGDGGGDSW